MTANKKSSSSSKTPPTKKSSPANPLPEDLSFEQSLEKIEQIARQLEEGNLGLSESLSRYEEGVILLRRCHQTLQQAEQKVELLAGVDPQGRPITTPFDEQEMSLSEKAASRSKRRSQKRRLTDIDDRVDDLADDIPQSDNGDQDDVDSADALF